jgi:hypothetical protein
MKMNLLRAGLCVMLLMCGDELRAEQHIHSKNEEASVDHNTIVDSKSSFLVGRKWAVMKGSEDNEIFQMFRKYTWFNSEPKNNMIFNCAKPRKNVNSNITLILPNESYKGIFDQKSWVPEARVRIMVDDKFSFAAIADCNKGELFVDRSEANSSVFDKMLEATSLVFAVEGKVLASFDSSEKVDYFLDDVETKNAIPGLNSLNFFDMSKIFEKCSGSAVK